MHQTTPSACSPSGLTVWDVAPGRHALWAASAAQLSAWYDADEVSPVAVLDSILARIDAVDGHVRAYVHVDRAGALAAARAAEQRMRQGARLGPLDGVPVHVKDNLFVRGMPCTWGSRLFADHVPAQDDVPVARLRQAGAVLLGKTNTPEFALLGRTTNALFGDTFNPWQLTHTPGGSSGGCAAALAAGMGPLGLATDAGGSIRRPASYCGVVGLRTTRGQWRRRHGFPATVHDFQTVGPMARTAADAALLFDALADAPAMGVMPERLRIGVVLTSALSPVEGAVAAGVRSVADALQAAGHEVTALDAAPWDAQEIEWLWRALSTAGAARLAHRYGEPAWSSSVDPAIQAMAHAAAGITAVDYIDALERLQVVRQQAEDWFLPFDVLLTPTSPCTAWLATEAYPSRIDGVEAGPRAASAYAVVANAADLPALSLPVGLDGEGLPIGAQLLGRRGSDRVLLALAVALQSTSGRATVNPLFQGEPS